MKNLKAVLCILLAVVMLCGLAGCWHKVTAESLVKGIEKIEEDKYYDMGLEMDISGSTEDAGDVSMTLKTNVEGCGDITHIYDATLGVGASGFTMEIDMEGWMDRDEGYSYYNGKVFGQETGWTKKVLDNSDDEEDSMNVSKLSDMLADGDSDKLKLLDHEDGEDYVVQWEFDDEMKKALSEMIGDIGGLSGAGGTDDLLGDMDNLDIDNAVMEAHFDEETEKIKSVHVEMEADSGDGEVSLSMTVTLNEVNGKTKLEVPQDVVEAAVEREDDEDEDDGSSDFGLEGSGSDDEWLGGLNWETSDNESEGGTSSGLDSWNDGEDEERVVYGQNGAKITFHGTGSDSVLDELAMNIAENDPDFYSIDVYYDNYDGSTRLEYSRESSKWDGSVSIRRSAGDTKSAKEAFKEECNFLVDYLKTEPAYGSIEEGYAVFMDKEFDKIEYITHDGDCYINGDMWYWGYDEVSVDDYIEHYNAMLMAAEQKAIKPAK